MIKRALIAFLVQTVAAGALRAEFLKLSDVGIVFDRPYVTGLKPVGLEGAQYGRFAFVQRASDNRARSIDNLSRRDLGGAVCPGNDNGINCWVGVTVSANCRPFITIDAAKQEVSCAPFGDRQQQFVFARFKTIFMDKPDESNFPDHEGVVLLDYDENIASLERFDPDSDPSDLNSSHVLTIHLPPSVDTSRLPLLPSKDMGPISSLNTEVDATPVAFVKHLNPSNLTGGLWSTEGFSPDGMIGNVDKACLDLQLDELRQALRYWQRRGFQSVLIQYISSHDLAPWWPMATVEGAEGRRTLKIGVTHALFDRGVADGSIYFSKTTQYCGHLSAEDIVRSLDEMARRGDISAAGYSKR